MLPKSTTKTSLRNRLNAGTIQLSGVSTCFNASAPDDPVAAAAELASYGLDHIRIHHSEQCDLKKMLAFLDEIKAWGMFASICLADSLHEQFHTPNVFKNVLYQKDPKAEALFMSNLMRLSEVLDHPALFLAVLVNEGGWHTTPELADAFWKKWAKIIKCAHKNLLLSDCPLPIMHPFDQDRFDKFGMVAGQYDLTTGHYYVSDEKANGTKDNLLDWQWPKFVEYAKKTGRPFILNEFGSYKSNPHQGSNIMFVLAECKRHGFSATHFDYSDQPNYSWLSWGSAYSITKDEFRKALTHMGVNLFKYGGRSLNSSWKGSEYTHEFENAYADRNHVWIRVSKTKELVYTLDKEKPRLWKLRSQ